MSELTRRSFLGLFGVGTGAAIVAPGLLLPEPEPIRRYWQVPRNAPVGGVTITAKHPGPELGDAIWLTSNPAEAREQALGEIWLNDQHGHVYQVRDRIVFDPQPRGFEWFTEADKRTGVVTLSVALRPKAEPGALSWSAKP